MELKMIDAEAAQRRIQEYGDKNCGYIASYTMRKDGSAAFLCDQLGVQWRYDVTAWEIEEAKEHVARGAALLDEKLPGWHERIVLPLLDISSCRMCICGQIGMALTEDVANQIEKAQGILAYEDSPSYIELVSLLLDIGEDESEYGFTGEPTPMATEIAWHMLIEGRLKEGNNG